MKDFLDTLASPDIQYGPVPFWFLNDRLSRWEIRCQLNDFHQHGIPGVVVHPRMGFDSSVPYLSARYMDWMEFICETAQSLSMFVYLYDEGMYPSGAAGGQVVAENPSYAAKALSFSETLSDDAYPVAMFSLPVNECGEPDAEHARIIHDISECLPGETVRYACRVFSHGTIRGLHPDEDDGGPHAPAAADLLNPDAVSCFIRLTHERYWSRLSRFFGTTVRAFFTDEPNPLGRNTSPGLISWTDGMEDEWLEKGYSLEDLPLLFLPGPRADKVRADHAFLVREHMMRTYYSPLHDWCDLHGIFLTGHPAWPDAMDMEAAFSLPGQDLVWGWVARGETSLCGPESTLAQCAADAALHAGKAQSLCECFGCCGPKESQWGMTLSDIKWMSDWLFVRGISQLVPHAFFYSLRLPEARADRPPDVGPNNIFWPFYSDFSAYAARMCMLNHGRFSLSETVILTDGVHLDFNISRELYIRQIPFHYLTLTQFLKMPIHGMPVAFPGQNVSLVILPPSVHQSVDLDAHICAFRHAGGQVIDSAQQNWTDLLSSARVPLRFSQTPDLRLSWQVRNGEEYLLLTNEGNDCTAPFTLDRYRHVEIMDAWSGERNDLGTLSTGCLHLKKLQSLIVRLSEPAYLKNDISCTEPEWEEVDISSRLSPPVDGGPFPRTRTYTLSLPPVSVNGPVYLVFSGVHDLAVLSGPDFETHLLIEPWEVELPEALLAHAGPLKVTVTASRVTEMDGIPWPCGLSGSVKLRYPRQKT